MLAYDMVPDAFRLGQGIGIPLIIYTILGHVIGRIVAVCSFMK